ncbi:uncharacterized protein LOC126797084 [Argentina anserina]|uniref:uncharacterized protein LOC126797084 n=1 Tax=Argentina anserina TaxID=57926 RepID=UPI002176736F|nr:uncharacterized protein LOC126797084 [Potentilla anserina]
MRDDETIDDFYSRFTDLSSLCESLGRPLQESDIVRKILRSLPKSYRMKKTTIQEQYNLNTYSVDLLIGNLKAWEMELEEDERPKGMNSKNIALSVTKNPKSSYEEAENNEQLILEFEKFLSQRKSNSNEQNNQNSRRNFNRNNRRFEKRKDNYSQKKYEYGNSSNNNKKCYTCGGIGHVATNCGNKKFDSGNKAYKSSWSDDDDSYLKRDKIFALVSSFSLDYAGSKTEHEEDQEEDGENSYEDNEMFEYQAKVIKAAEKISEKNILLKQQVEKLEGEKMEWEVEKLNLRKKSDNGDHVLERKWLLAKIQMLQDEVIEKDNLIDLLNSKLSKLQNLLDGTDNKVGKFQNSSKSLSDILSSGKSYNDRTGLGYTGSKASDTYIGEHEKTENIQTSFNSKVIKSNDIYEKDIKDIRSKLEQHGQFLRDISHFVGLSKSYKETKHDVKKTQRYPDYESDDKETRTSELSDDGLPRTNNTNVQSQGGSREVDKSLQPATKFCTVFKQVQKDHSTRDVIGEGVRTRGMTMEIASHKGENTESFDTENVEINKALVSFIKEKVKGTNVEIIGYSDADWRGNLQDRKSTSGGCVFVGKNLVA